MSDFLAFGYTFMFGVLVGLFVMYERLKWLTRHGWKFPTGDTRDE